MNSLALRLASSSAARSSSSVLRLKSRTGASRNIHKRIPLPYSVEGGLGDFLPPAALKTVAVDYQEGLLRRLDEEVRGSPEAVESIAQTVLNTASSRERVLAFNYASLALNNSYFLDQLLPPPTEGEWKNHQHEMSSQMASVIRTQYGSMVQFKSAFSSAVTGLFTSGYVWFVTDRNGNTGIIPTLGPGTLLIRSRSYMGHSKSPVLGPDLMQYDSSVPYTHTAWDAETMGATEEEMLEEVRPLRPPTMPTSPPPPGVNPTSPVSGVSGGKLQPQLPNALGPKFLSTSTVLSDYNRKTDNLYNKVIEGKPPAQDPRPKVASMNLGEVLYPLFCISVHEHAWMSAGYGVWGKEEWLRQFWSVLNWKKVSESYVNIIADGV
ncbi:hypothetical protein H0H87_011802 [Tephrocybe sp. NHM501043]|nr:hypothetical protein H0H87_011802 [Tephrocybe sp. NHM501043]